MDFTNVAKALTARGFKVSSFETAKEAAEKAATEGTAARNTVPKRDIHASS